MEDFRETLKSIVFSKNLWASIAVVAVAVGLWFLIKKLFIKFLENKDRNAKTKTHTKFIANLIKYLILIFCALTVLQINGVNVSSLLTGLGVAGVVVGFALQDILKDIIMGTNIIMDNFFSVGDVVRYGGIEAKIISFNIKVTKMQDVDSGDILTVSNRNISEITKVSELLCVSVPASYEVPADKMRNICEEIKDRVNKLKPVKKCTFEGTQELSETRISYMLFIYTKPENKKPVMRSANGIIQDVFSENGLKIPSSLLYKN